MSQARAKLCRDLAQVWRCLDQADDKEASFKLERALNDYDQSRFIELYGQARLDEIKAHLPTGLLADPES